MRVTNYDLYDRLLGGTLAETLTTWKYDERLSLADIVRRLHSEHDIVTSVETVRRWLQRIESEAVAS